MDSNSLSPTTVTETRRSVSTSVASIETSIWETASTVTTVWGPGTLSGKAIKSLGEATLAGVEKVIIRWKLANINSKLMNMAMNLPSDSPSGHEYESLYDDLLELSRYVPRLFHCPSNGNCDGPCPCRLDFYDTKVRQKALALIMMQIGSRETAQLIKCIIKWPVEEIRIFLSEIVPCVPLIWQVFLV